MSTHELFGTTALVTGASRGFGRGVASAMSAAGARVIGVARDHDRLAALKPSSGNRSCRSSPTPQTHPSPAS